jgi:hypothetical protein
MLSRGSRFLEDLTEHPNDFVKCMVSLHLGHAVRTVILYHETLQIRH